MQLHNIRRRTTLENANFASLVSVSNRRLVSKTLDELESQQERVRNTAKRCEDFVMNLRCAAMSSTGSAVASPSNVDAAWPQKSPGASFATLSIRRVAVLSIVTLISNFVVSNAFSSIFFQVYCD